MYLYCKSIVLQACIRESRGREASDPTSSPHRGGSTRFVRNDTDILGIISVDGVGSGCGDGVLVAGSWEVYGVWRRSSYQRKESEGTCSVLQCIATQYVSIDLCSLPYAWYCQDVSMATFQYK